MTPEGSLFMATVNDDAAGVYACTPYNSFGSMGPSGPTNVRLQVSVRSRPALSVEVHGAETFTVAAKLKVLMRKPI